MTSPARLSDHPDWTYALQDCYDLYRWLPAGGSGKIRTHQRSVRERISRVMQADAEVRFGEPVTKPVTAHLKRALNTGRMGPLGNFVRTLDAILARVAWQYGYEKVPRGLEQKYAYAELVGPTGPVITNEVILGLVLFAPGCTYPAHAHKGISESYICLAGAVSENDQGVYAPGSLIFNPPEQVHRITVADHNPSLLFYAWEGDPARLAGQKMVFTRKGG